MKALLSTVAVGAMSLFLCATPARSFQEPDKDRQEPEKQKPEEKQRPEEKPQPEKGKPADTTHREDANKPETHREANKPEQPARGQEARPQENRERGNGNGKMERTGNHNSYRIPDDRFRGHFGRSHVFHVERGAREFAFSGFNFTFVDPWPADWAYTDDVYVDFIDGEYYLIDPVHPRIRVLVIVAG